MLQGAPCATVDTDIWVDLPVRQYVRILTIAQRLGANILSGCVIGLRDDHRIDGLAAFRTEWKRAIPLVWAGVEVKVLPIDRLIRSKEAANRPKDLIHLSVLRDYLKSIELLRG